MSVQSKMTAIANAIRAKTGNSGSLTLDQMAEQIAALSNPTGTKTITDTALTDVSAFANAQVVDADLVAGNIKKDVEILGVTGTYEGSVTSDPLHIYGCSSVTINADYADAETIIAHCCGGINGNTGSHVKHITFMLDTLPSTSNTASTYRYGKDVLSVVESITFINCPLSSIYQGFQVVYGTNRTSLKSIYGLDMRYANTGNYTYGNAFMNQNKLENVTCIPNTFGQRAIGATGNVLSFASTSILTDASLVSIANGLCADNVSTLQFSATQTAHCSEIMGTVSSVTDDTGTYNFFTANASGTTSLASFITTTKGWTLA